MPACQVIPIEDLSSTSPSPGSPSTPSSTVTTSSASGLAGNPASRLEEQPAVASPTIPTQNSPAARTITAAGIGPAQLGMTFEQLKQRLGPEAGFKVESPFRVDFDAIAVSQSGGRVQYYLLYPAGTTLADGDPIQSLVTDNPNYHTVEGVGPRTLLQKAVAVYGQATLAYNTANDSREVVRLANQPARNIHFRPMAVGHNFAGIYLSSLKEYNETRKYQNKASIGSVEVVCLPPSCANP